MRPSPAERARAEPLGWKAVKRGVDILAPGVFQKIVGEQRLWKWWRWRWLAMVEEEGEQQQQLARLLNPKP